VAFKLKYFCCAISGSVPCAEEVCNFSNRWFRVDFVHHPPFCCLVGYRVSICRVPTVHSAVTVLCHQENNLLNCKYGARHAGTLAVFVYSSGILLVQFVRW